MLLYALVIFPSVSVCVIEAECAARFLASIFLAQKGTGLVVQPVFLYNIQVFLWKSLHQAHHCSHYWLHIPNYKQWADCHVCNNFESLGHILSECDTSGQSIIWPLTQELWLKKLPWPTLSLSSILGCMISDFHNPTGHPLPGTN